MNEKMKKEYRDTFSEVHAPAALARKVMNMSENKNNQGTGISVIRRLATVAAIALVLLIGSNGIVYAATGSSLLKTVKVYFNGTSYEANLEKKTGEDDVTYYEGTFEDADGTINMVITDDINADVDSYVVSAYNPEVIEEDGKIYLTSEGVKIDITEDLEDGVAEGTYEMEGLETSYKVTEKDGEWDIMLSGGDYEFSAYDFTSEETAE